MKVADSGDSGMSGSRVFKWEPPVEFLGAGRSPGHEPQLLRRESITLTFFL